jgi:PKD repeat protein
MKNLIILFLIFFLLSCKKEESPVSCFEFTPDNFIKTGDTIEFENCSGNSGKYLWLFGDGNSSNEISPSHYYQSSATYKVDLFSINDDKTDTMSRIIYVGPRSKDFDVGDYKFDIDIDGKDDLSIKVRGYYSRTGLTLYYIQFKMLNGFEINVSQNSQTDSTLIPRIHVLSDVVYLNDRYSKDSIMLTYSERICISVFPLDYEFITRGPWVSSQYHYAVFRKVNENSTILAWLKLNVPTFSYFSILDYKCFKNQPEVIIKE